MDAGHVWLCDLPLFCWGSGNCLFTLARVCQGGSELIPDLNFCCFDPFRQKRLEHWGSSSVIIWTQTTCSCKSLSKNPSLMNAQWSPPVWINLFVKLCPTLSWLNSGLWIEYNSTQHLQVSYSIMQHLQSIAWIAASKFPQVGMKLCSCWKI